MVAAVQHPLQPPPILEGSRGSKRSIKLVSCIIRAEKLDIVTESVNKLNLVGGMTVTDVRGFGHAKPFQGPKYFETFVPRVRVEIAVEAEDVEDVEVLISELARTGEVGDGKIFVLKVIDAVRVRTGERGVAAL